MTEPYLREDVAAYFQDDPLAVAWSLTGEVVRDVAGRQTLRVEIGGDPYYLKRHEGVGWREIAKNLLVGKLPVLGARNEFEACRYLASQGIDAPRVAAFAEGPGSPAGRASFVLCDALLGYEDLETVTGAWHHAPPDPLEVRRMLIRVARFAARLHGAGVAHRDFYLCHLLERRDGSSARMAVLDLHRARVFRQLPDRWRKRDLAALLFSAMDLPVGRRGWYRFVRIYSGRPLAEEFRDNGAFWQSVYRRALKLYRKGQRKGLTRGRPPS